MHGQEIQEGFLPVGVSGKLLDTVVVEQADGTKVHREAVVTTDPLDSDARANVAQPDGLDFHSARTTDHELKHIAGLLRELVGLQKGTLRLLEAAFDDGLSSEIDKDL